MKQTILIALFSIPIIFAQDTTLVIFGESEIFTVDSENPTVDWQTPNGGEEFESGEIVNGEWTASDSYFDNTPISIFLSTVIGGNFEPLSGDIPNESPAELQLPVTDAAFSRIKVIATDHFGNTGEDFSDGYFVIGNPDDGGGEDSTIVIFAESDIITVDSENPAVDWQSPNGGEEYESGETITGEWTASDSYFDDTPISVYLSTVIGGDFEPLSEDIANESPALLELPETDIAFSRLKVIATDHFGNTGEDFSDGYFVIGNPDDGGGEDSTVVIFAESDSFVVDSKNPEVDLIAPNGGPDEIFTGGEEIGVSWTASDDSFGDGPITLTLADYIGDWFLDLAIEIPNSSPYDVIAPDTTLDFARMRVTAVDGFGNASIDESEDYFQIIESQEATQVISYNDSWNIVGLPLTVSDSNYQTLFPESIEGTLYGYNGIYTSETDLEIGNGYWLRFWESGSTTITGSPFLSITIPISEGWNLISGTSASSGIVDPDGIIISGTLYGYNNAYYNASSLDPGFGYWVRATADGEIIIDSDLSKKTVIESPVNIAGTNILSFRNSQNHEALIYYGMKISEEDKLNFSLPPVPPPGGFDVRFGGDIKLVEDGGEILIQNELWPLTISLEKGVGDKELVAGEWYLVDELNGKEYSFNESGTIEIAEPTHRLTLKRKNVIPEHFALHQNYPNPFNPITKIRYSLPEISYVKLTIYDLTGRLVKTLVNETQQAGEKSVVWNARDVASGIYIYRIQSGEFTQTRKMVLLK